MNTAGIVQATVEAVTAHYVFAQRAEQGGR